MNFSSAHSNSNFAHSFDFYCLTILRKISFCGGWFLFGVSYYVIFQFTSCHSVYLSGIYFSWWNHHASRWFILAQKNAKFRVRQFHVCYLHTTHLSPLKSVVLNYISIITLNFVPIHTSADSILFPASPIKSQFLESLEYKHKTCTC